MSPVRRRNLVRPALLGALAVSVAFVAPLDAWCNSHQRGERARVADVTQGDPRWSAVEQRVWEDIGSGRQVKLSGSCPDWRAADAQPGSDVDSSTYTIRGGFLRQIMTEDPYRTLIGERPIAISGARIVGDVVVDGGRSKGSVTIACSILEGQMRFVARQMDRTLKLFRVRTTKGVEFDGVTARSDVIVQRSDVESVRVTKSRINGSLSLRGTRVRSATRIAGVELGHGPLMGCAITSNNRSDQGCHGLYGRTEIISVETRRSMELDRSVFVDDVVLQAVDVGGTLLARQVEHATAFTVMGGTIAGRLEMDGGTSHGPVHIEGLRIQEGVALRKGSYPDVSILSAEITHGLDFRASKLGRLDLSATTVGGELRLGMEGGEVDWGAPRDDAHFIARNTRVSSLQDTVATWPPWLRRELDGFEYEKLGGLEDPPGDAPYLRGAEWFKQWLAGDESYSPQPYRHLSEVLRREGQTEVANAILYEAKERERTALPWHDSDRLWLEVLRFSVGYGVGLKALRALGWMAALALVGWIVGVCATRRQRLSPWTLFWYSVSYSVPGFSVVKADGEEVKVSLRARSWFYTQRLICYGFALLAAAAAVGIVQR